MVTHPPKVSRLTLHFFFAWLLLVVFLASLVSVIILGTITQAQSAPVLTEALTPTLTQASRTLPLYDGVKVVQTFPLKSQRFSHLALGLVNQHAANPSAVITAAISSANSPNEIASVIFPVSSLWEDDLTLIPFSANLPPAEFYQVTLTSAGIPRSQALSVLYEPSQESFPSGQLTYVTSNPQNKEGNIRFQILAFPTLPVIVSRLLPNLPFWSLVAVILSAFLLWLPKPRTYLAHVLAQPQIPTLVPRHLVSREYLCVSLLGLTLSFITTLPFYTHLNYSDTMGDVQRMLLYRALGRDSLLQDHRLAQWDPYSCGGMPLLANIESAHLDPFFWIFTLPFGENLGLR